MKVLVVGAAKTGTTIISKTIEGSLTDAHFHMEPQETAFFMMDSATDPLARVVKVIFEHWDTRPNLRKAIIANELPFKFDRTLMIVRDPRDEMLSRMMYFVYPWLTENGYIGNEAKVENWLRFIARVENAPADYSFKKIVAFMNDNFSVSLLGTMQNLNKYRAFCEVIKDSVHLLRYEDFMAGDYSATEDYLGFPLSTESGLNHTYQRTRRSLGFNNWKPLFKQEDKAFFSQHLGDMMEKQGYTDWEFEAAATLPVENYSEYLRRIVADYRATEADRQFSSGKKKSLFGFLRQ